MSDAIWIAIITAVCSGGLGAAVVAFFKDRRKDNATAKLTDVQALQQQVLLLTQVSDYLRKENHNLKSDYEQSEESRRKMRLRMEELESKLATVERECSSMRIQLKEMKGEVL